MQKFLPIFPLSMVAYPGEELKLHIFEPRYKQLIRECIQEEKSFGIPVINKNEILDYGTEMIVNGISKEYLNGEVDIVITGLQAFRILDIVQVIPDKLYSGAVVSVINNVLDIHSNINNEFDQLTDELFQMLEIQNKLVEKGIISQSFKMAHYVGFNILEEFELLKHSRESVRKKIIIQHIKNILPGLRQAAAIRKRAKMNGQFHILNPPDFL
ncbi:MAG: LON peptidase substrate-binding domain-containing protein [Bacteroidetes bacterium]|nr:LON peptidase substrate-binding domain-containing protein [Bacteroidota bacterium]MBK7110556.1 LON peptidase substrate-binding domain-containing protein [Bacteroidota bacterium]MBK8488223.1 LON peptidase substrate-binding domain-containing protein [Bacteroidota bacterium]MBK8682016.1 LON peptidase substrate-binding domain-containing protein [Bacteroidota bacterium]